MKIAICGKMASGKTTLADWFVEHHDFQKISLAAKVKSIAADLFGILIGQLQASTMLIFM